MAHSENGSEFRTLSLEWPRAALMILSVLAVGWYMQWRITTLNPALPVFSLLLFAAELFGAAIMLLHLFMMWRLSARSCGAPEPGLSVDVFIPTLNEPVSVVRRTALTATAMDYPHQTWILDDGNRPEMRALAEELGCGYLARTDSAHAKAGNLNHALQHTRGEFIALFDADHAPRRDFLTRTLGYFRDPKLAFVQTPQDFYNLDSYQHRADLSRGRLWTEQSLFFRIIQRGKDVWNAAFLCGSCAVIRRSALEAIGGFGTGTITEDLHTSIRLHKAGYHSVYHAESLAFGIAAAQIEPFLKQRIRWGQGAMQVWRRERILTSRRLTWPQKLCYLASILIYFEGWQKCVFYFTPAVVLCTGLLPIQTTPDQFLLHFIPYLIACLWFFTELGRGYCNVVLVEQYNMIRFAAFCWSTLGLFRRNLKFRVTDKHLAGVPAYDYYLLPQYAVLSVNALGIVIGAVMYAHGTYLNGFAFSANVAWATVNIVISASVFSFTLQRLGFKRHDYRFSIPLVATFTLRDGRTAQAAVQDISSAGMQLALHGAADIRAHDEIQGALRLPGETIAFTARVRAAPRRRGEGGRTIGCEFLWQTPQAQQRLELFLYGSNLEWEVHGITERSPTLLERIFSRGCRWHALEGRSVSARHYDARLPMLYGTPDSRHETPGILARGRHGQHLAMLFAPMENPDTLDAKVFTGTRWERLQARIQPVNRNEIDTHHPMYVHEVKGGISYAV